MAFSRRSDLERILIATCQRNPPPNLRQRLAEIGRGPELARFVDLASRHHVRGLALAALEDAGVLGTAHEELARRLADLRRRVALFQLETLRLYRTLDATGAEPVVLKGSALLSSFYADPVQRDLADIDILVRPERVFDSIHALESAGYAYPMSAMSFDSYRQNHFHVPLRHPLGYMVEIHWDLVKPHSPFRLDPDAVRRRAGLAGSGNGGVRIPAPEHLVLHLVIQNVQEGFSRLSRLLDVDRILAARSGVDVSELANRAELGRLEVSTALTLHLARHLLGTSVPPELTDRFSPGSVTRRHLALLDPIDSLLRQRFAGRPSWYRLLRFWLLPGWKLRRAALRDWSRGRRDDAAPMAWTDTPRTRTTSSRLHGAGELGKLLACQVWSYLASLPRQLTVGREGIRFWSSHANNSDRL
jgi:hypothetical protein